MAEAEVEGPYYVTWIAGNDWKTVAKSIQNKMNKLHHEGYTLLSITQVNDSDAQWDHVMLLTFVREG